jgi:hypothetical protein
MKIGVLVLCFFCAATAFGQASGVVSAMSSQPQVIEFTSHTEFATQHAMGNEQNLLETEGYTWAQGERPLWEVAPASHPTPLGDSARMLKKEHTATKKADIVWSN